MTSSSLSLQSLLLFCCKGLLYYNLPTDLNHINNIQEASNIVIYYYIYLVIFILFLVFQCIYSISNVLLFSDRIVKIFELNRTQNALIFLVFDMQQLIKTNWKTRDKGRRKEDKEKVRNSEISFVFRYFFNV